MSAEDVAEDYRTALSDLDNNSKPLITMLTMLAEENKGFPAVIVEEVANRIKTTPHKLPAMYLIDSIVKNVGSDFVRLFGNVIANLFSEVFKEVDERTRKKLYELRQTWNEVFPSSRLYMLDVKIHEVDPAWPMSLQPKLGPQTGPNIHVNPNKFSHQSIRSTTSTASDLSKINSVSPSIDDLTELKRLQSEKRVLAVERKIIEKQILNENVKAIEPLDQMHSLEPKLNMTPNRQSYMKNYKIKKKPPTADEKPTSISTEKKVMSNIHVAPWKVNEILPKMTGSAAASSISKESRSTVASPRDPRISFHDNKASHRIFNKESPKDPRLIAYKEQQKINVSIEPIYSPIYEQPVASRGKWVSGNSEPVTQTITTGLKNALNARPFLAEPIKLNDNITSELKKSIEIKRVTKERLECGREEIVSIATKRDIDPKIRNSPHRKNRKDIDEKVFKEKLDVDERDKDKMEREKRDKDEKDTKVKDEKAKEAKDKDERDKKVKDDEKKFQSDWCKKVKEAREKKEENNKKLKEEKEKKEKKDKDERVKRDKDERGKKDKDERDKKEKDKNRNDVDDRNKKDICDKNKRESEERQKKDLSNREKKDIDDRNVIEANVVGKKNIDDRAKKSKDIREKKDKDDKEKKDKDDKEKRDKIRKEKDESNQKDILEREKLEKCKLTEETEKRDKEDKETKEKKEAEELLKDEKDRRVEEDKLRLIERKKTEQLLKERYEQAMREAENESKLKHENEKETLLEKCIVQKQADVQQNVVVCEKRKKDLGENKSNVKEKPKQKGKIKSSFMISSVEHKNIAKDNKTNWASIAGSDKGKDKLTKSAGQHADKMSIKKKDISSNIVQALPVSDDKFKVQTDSSSKRREHIRPREKTPVKDVLSSNKSSHLTPSKMANSGVARESSRLNRDKDDESDDSDHYDANKPQPSTYALKKAKINEVELSNPKKETFLDASGTDTDLRLLTSQSNSANSASDIRPKSSSQLGDLFGTCDTDLRQLPPATIFPHNQLSVNATGILPGVVIINPFISKPDQDLRENLVSSKVRDVKENKDRLNRVIEDISAFPTSSGEEKAMVEGDIQSKKHCFSSPHSAKWAEFRGKNPEFQEYQRQAGISEKLEMFMSRDGPNFSLSADRPSSRSGRRGRLPDWRHINFASLDDDWFFEKKDSKSEENYQFKINQLNDQFKKGDIPEIAYMRMMEDIRIRIEQDKIREVQLKERDGRPCEGDWIRESPNIGKKESETFDGKPGLYADRFQDRKWQPYMRGRSRDSPLPRGPSPSGIEPKVDDEWTGEVDLPTLSADVLRTVSKESETAKIEIDGLSREIRTYGEKAIVLMEWDDPRTLEFETMTCDVIFDEGKFTLTMSTRDGYRNVQIDRETHEIKLGVPGNELMIDGKGYQCFFGGKPISVYLAGKDRTICLSGKPPKVDIGTTKNLEYLVGKVQLIINAKKIVHLYLDAKPQKFTIDGMPFVLKFIDFFQAVNINGVKFPIIFGGLPISISVRGYRRFLRFSALPEGIIPGKTSVRGMDADGTILIPDYRSSPPPNRCGPSFPSVFSISPGQIPPSQIPSGPIPPISRSTTCNPVPKFPVPVRASHVPSFKENPPPLAPPPFPILLPPPCPPHLVTHPISQRMSHLPVSRVIPGSYLTTGTPQQSQNITPVTINMSVPPPSVVGNFSHSSIPSVAAPVVDVQSLLNNLVKTGLIGTNKKDRKDELKEMKEKGKKDDKRPIKEKIIEEDEEEYESDDLSDIPPLETMFNLENLRKQNAKLIKNMYRGMQCSSCGLRYPPDQTAQYSHHLDWHFRMNKKQQESTKKVNTRKFYLGVDDWFLYEEIEDLDERVPSMFEMEGVEDTKNPDENDEDVEEEVPSVSLSASSDPCLGVCPICHETFSQFYHQSTEDWHYKNAIQVDGINYHPACHQDLVKSQKNKEDKLKKEKEEEEKCNKEREEEEKLKKELEEEREKYKKELEEEVEHKNEQSDEKDEKKQVEKDDNPLKESEKVEEEQKKETTEEGEELKAEVEEIKNISQDDDDDIVEEAVEKAANIEIQIDDGEPIENIVPAQESEEAFQKKNDDSEGERKSPISDPTLQPDNIKKTGINGIGNIKIKDEPLDSEVGMTYEIIPRLPSLLADIPIKMEIPDDDGRYEDDIVQTFDIVDDEFCEEADENEKLHGNDSWNAQTTTADIAISIDGNTEVLSQPEASQPSTYAPKIKISVSKPSMANNVDNLENLNNDSSEKDFNKIPSFLDEFSDIFEPPPFTFDLKTKPTFEGVDLADQPTEHRGLEMSSLCSVM